MHIRITDAGHFIKKVSHEGKDVVVGVVTEVSDAFVAAVERDLPHVKFDKNVTPVTTAQVETGETVNVPVGANNATKDKPA